MTNYEVYSVRKVWRQLSREGIAVARCTVARLMTGMGLAGVLRGKSVKTTISNPTATCPRDKMNRQFHAPAPNRLWLSDFTSVATWAGKFYVTFLIDAFARRIIGWRVSRSMETQFVLDALEQALHDRRPTDEGLIIIATEAASTSPSSTPSAWQMMASSPRSVASATATTTLWPRP